MRELDIGDEVIWWDNTDNACTVVGKYYDDGKLTYDLKFSDDSVGEYKHWAMEHYGREPSVMRLGKEKRSILDEDLFTI